jgi:glycosyltransferase involved in cell wall biosynthesis
MRAIMSVAMQTYRPIQHIVVADGPNPELERLLRCISRDHPATGYEFVFECLPEHGMGGRWGHTARMRGIDLAKGEYIAYLDDDDAYWPEHVANLAQLLDDDPEIGFAHASLWMHDQGGDAGGWVCAAPTPCFGRITTSAIMHRRELLDVATWRDDGVQETVDWDLISRWVDSGVRSAFSEQVSAHGYREFGGSR